MLTCNRCGKENQDHYRFCLGCGSEIAGKASGRPEEFQARPPARKPIRMLPGPPATGANGGKVPPAAKKVTALECGYVHQLGWSSDGTALIALVEGISSTRLIRWSMVNGTVQHARFDSAISGFAMSLDGQIAVITPDAVQSLHPETLALQDTIVQTTCADLCWSPDGTMICLSDIETGIRIYDLRSNRLREINRAPGRAAWAPDGKSLALFAEGDLQIVSPNGAPPILIRRASERGRFASVGPEHQVVWTPDGRQLIYTSDSTLRAWDVTAGSDVNVVELHQRGIRGLACSMDGRFVAVLGKADLRFWDTQSWTELGYVAAPKKDRTGVVLWGRPIAFHPKTGMIVAPNEETREAVLWELNADVPSERRDRPSQYVNAKIVLLGDSGVGKSGLGLVLSGRAFVPTESTHGRRIWTFEQSEVVLPDGTEENREVLLWDLAGQPGYRLIHQLHLDEVAVAIVVFDATSEVDPFAGIRYWSRALQQASRLRGGNSGRTIRLLVSARRDRGGIEVGPDRLRALLADLGFDDYIDTSAKEGWGVDRLRALLKAAISWNELPKLRSTDLFRTMRAFILTEKKNGCVLSRVNDLLARFMNVEFDSGATSRPGAARTGAQVLRNSANVQDREDLAKTMRELFMASIARLESSGLVRRLSFGDMVLLQPEILDAYASAMVNAARSEPDGLGILSAEDASTGRFAMPSAERVSNREDERLLLIATVEDLIRHEIALKEQTEAGPYLVFPSQVTREISSRHDAAATADKATVIMFQGAVLNIYATLVVRLSHSGRFLRRQIWRHGATFESRSPGRYTIVFRELEEGSGELDLSHESGGSQETWTDFERYVQAHIEARAVQGSVQRRTVVRCGGCQTPVSELQAERRRQRGFDSMVCPVCDLAVPLTESAIPNPQTAATVVASMDRRADATRDSTAATFVLAGKRKLGEFDVFLCHNSLDKEAVKAVGEQLKAQGILPWLDEWELRPGLPWQRALEGQIGQIKTAAVFVGAAGLGPWQEPEVDAFLRQFVRRACPVIPVLLKDAPSQPTLPVFLEAMTWVDYRKVIPNPLERLVWGITGER